MTEAPQPTSLPPKQKRWVVLLSSGILLLTLDLVRRRKVREEDSWIWLLVGVVTFVLGMHYRLLQRISQALGIVTPTSTIFFFGQIFLMLLAMQTSMRNADTFRNLKNVIQEITLLRWDLENLASRLSADASDE
jgi:hypothetical protein